MAYMLNLRFTTAIKEAYAGHRDRRHHLEEARRSRAWLESLAIDPRLRAALVEPIAAVEEAFEELAAGPERSADSE